MPMERSVSCAERSAPYGGAAAAAGVDLRSYSASYAPRAPPKVSRARSTSAWARPAPGAVQRSGSAKSASGAPRLNLRSYSASYAASYAPAYDGAGAGAAPAELKRAGSTTAAAAGTWSSANRRSVNLRGYTPSFAALDDTAAGPAAVPTKKPAADGGGGGTLDDAELRRKKRLVVYKVYDVEGKVRDSVRRGVSWIKSKCSRVVYGWW